MDSNVVILNTLNQNGALILITFTGCILIEKYELGLDQKTPFF